MSAERSNLVVGEARKFTRAVYRCEMRERLFSIESYGGSFLPLNFCDFFAATVVVPGAALLGFDAFAGILRHGQKGDRRIEEEVRKFRNNSLSVVSDGNFGSCLREHLPCVVVQHTFAPFRTVVVSESQFALH